MISIFVYCDFILVMSLFGAQRERERRGGGRGGINSIRTVHHRSIVLSSIFRTIFSGNAYFKEKIVAFPTAIGALAIYSALECGIV